MSKPRKIDWMDLTRLGKYLLGTQDMVALKEVPKATKIVDKVSDIKSAYDEIGMWRCIQMQIGRVHGQTTDRPVAL